MNNSNIKICNYVVVVKVLIIDSKFSMRLEFNRNNIYFWIDTGLPGGCEFKQTEFSKCLCLSILGFSGGV